MQGVGLLISVHRCNQLYVLCKYRPVLAHFVLGHFMAQLAAHSTNTVPLCFANVANDATASEEASPQRRSCRLFIFN